MTFGCQKSLIMKAPYFWWSQSSLLSSYTKMWNVCVVWPEPTWRWQYNRDFIVFSRHDDKYVHSCNCHRLQSAWKKKRILKTMGTKQWSKPYSYREMLQSPSKLLLLLFPRPRVNFLQYVWALDACFSGLCTSHSTSFRSFCCLALVLLLLWFKVEPGAFLKCIFRRAYIGIAKSQNVQN